MSTTSNKNAAPGMSLGSGLDFFTITTETDITPAAAPSKDAAVPASQLALNKVVETISLNGQPVIMQVGAGSVEGTFVLKFAVEHKGAWDAAGLQAALIAAGLDDGTTVVAATL